MNLYVFDDHTADGWTPFSLTRPCGELRYGDRLLRQRLERFAGQPATATLSRSWLSQFTEPGSAPVLGPPGTAPGLGFRSKAMLEVISFLSGGTVFSDEVGLIL